MDTGASKWITIEGNEKADELAKKGTESQNTIKRHHHHRHHHRRHTIAAAPGSAAAASPLIYRHRGEGREQQQAMLSASTSPRKQWDSKFWVIQAEGYEEAWGSTEKRAAMRVRILFYTRASLTPIQIPCFDEPSVNVCVPSFSELSNLELLVTSCCLAYTTVRMYVLMCSEISRPAKWVYFLSDLWFEYRPPLAVTLRRHI